MEMKMDGRLPRRGVNFVSDVEGKVKSTFGHRHNKGL